MDNIKIPDHVTWKNMETGSVLLDINTSNYFTLNEMATIIWKGLSDDLSIDAINDLITAEFDADKEQVTNDINKQLNYFVEEGLLERS